MFYFYCNNGSSWSLCWKFWYFWATIWLFLQICYSLYSFWTSKSIDSASDTKFWSSLEIYSHFMILSPKSKHSLICWVHLGQFLQLHSKSFFLLQIAFNLWQFAKVLSLIIASGAITISSWMQSRNISFDKEVIFKDAKSFKFWHLLKWASPNSWLTLWKWTYLILFYEKDSWCSDSQRGKSISIN